jgi:exosortase
MLMKKKATSVLVKAAASARTHYQYILSIVLAVALVLLVYGNDLSVLANEALQNEALSHILLIPLFAGLLFYLKRDTVKASMNLEKYRRKDKTRYLDEAIGLALCIISFLTYWYGSYTFYPLEYHLLSLPIFVAGITLILLNLKALTALILPILFLAFLVPLPADFMYTAGGALANVNTQASYALLKALGVPVALSTDYGAPTLVLTTSAGQPASFTVDLPCSGIYSLIAFTMFATFLVLVALAPILKKAILFALGFIVFMILNIIRITTIVSIAHWFGQDIAMFLFHNIAGLVLTFAGMLLVLAVAERFLKIQILPKRRETPPCPECGKDPRMPSFCLNCGSFLKPLHTKISPRFWTKMLLLFLGCSLVVFSINAPTFAVAQGLIEVTSNPTKGTATNVLPNATAYRQPPIFLYRDTAYEKLAGQDASLTYAYFPLNRSHPVVYVTIGVSSSISNLHNWEVCLISWQTAQGKSPIVSVLDSRDVQLLQDVPLIARFLTFRSPYNYTQTTLYWYEKATFNTGITVEQKYVRISLIILTQNSTGYAHHEEELLALGQDIASYWEPLKTQSLISLGVPVQQSLLAISIAFVAITKTTQYSADWRKKRNNQKIFDKYATPQEKQVLTTISNLTKQKKTMETREISEALKASGNTATLDELLQTLNHLEEYSFIRKDVTSFGNQPRLVWRAKY